MKSKVVLSIVGVLALLVLASTGLGTTTDLSVEVRVAADGQKTVALVRDGARVKTLHQTFAANTEINGVGFVEGHPHLVRFRAHDPLWRSYYYWDTNTDALYYRAFDLRGGLNYYSENLPSSGVVFDLTQGHDQRALKKAHAIVAKLKARVASEGASHKVGLAVFWPELIVVRSTPAESFSRQSRINHVYVWDNASDGWKALPINHGGSGREQVAGKIKKSIDLNNDGYQEMVFETSFLNNGCNHGAEKIYAFDPITNAFAFTGITAITEECSGACHDDERVETDQVLEYDRSARPFPVISVTGVETRVKRPRCQQTIVNKTRSLKKYQWRLDQRKYALLP